MISSRRIYLPDVVGAGYGEFWRWRGRYRVCKGSRASKKSKTTALWIIYNMMKYADANTLVVRKIYGTLKDSCYTELRWAIERLGVSHLWRARYAPLELEYIPTGQKIYFRGLDDPLKITSITVERGQLCWGWLEEAYEVSKEADFDMLDESIRGQGALWKQWTITLNPWNSRHWIKGKFFDDPDDETLAITTTYQCNEWLDDRDRKVFETMKRRNPRRYQVAGLGEWGIVEGLIYETWTEQEFTLKQIQTDSLETAFGLDFGYTNDPTAFVQAYVDRDARVLYVYDEIYKKGMSNREIAEAIRQKGCGKERITADSAEPKSITQLHDEYGLRIRGARKGRDSINNGIQQIQDYRIVVHPRCVNFLTELSLYSWATDKFGSRLNVPIDESNHLMDAMRYGMESGHTAYNAVAGGI